MKSNFTVERKRNSRGGHSMIKMWDGAHMGNGFEEAAMEQLRRTADLPFIHKHVAAMPDTHMGYGATVGSVVATKGAIVPAAVGVDIGCGMIAVETNIKADQLPDNLYDFRAEIERRVPHGRSSGNVQLDVGSWNSTDDIPKAYVDDFFHGKYDLNTRLSDILKKHPKLDRTRDRAAQHIGTLGTGNHFIELCLDEKQALWVMLHSGSRGVGNAIGNHFIDAAKEEMERYFIHTLEDKDLSYLVEHTSVFDDYVEAVGWGQDYAMFNREMMMTAVIDALHAMVQRKKIPDFLILNEAINCHHNYVERENHFGANVWVTRKGAVRAREGDLGIIPGSMGAKSYIVRGLGNKESFCSCSHGAGRVMSRTQGIKNITVEEHVEAMKGIEARLDAGVLDESPANYKDIDNVMEAQRDLVEPVATLRQIVNVKG